MCFYQNLCEIYLKDMLDFAKNTTTFFLVAECVGRCPDCGGCNQGDKCQHYNVSGRPKHPSPDGTESWPLCSKTDGSRCFGENFYQIVDPHFNRPPIRIQTAPSSKRSRGKSRSNSMNSISRPSTSSSNSRPSSRGGASSKVHQGLIPHKALVALIAKNRHPDQIHNQA